MSYIGTGVIDNLPVYFAVIIQYLRVKLIRIRKDPKLLQGPDPELESMDPDPKLGLNLVKNHLKKLAVS
jgi:hypothetical protein